MTSPQIVRPYGDTTGDGMVQVSFTLPVPHGKRAEAAALGLAADMGLAPASVVHVKAMGPDFTFFIVYGRVNHLVDPGLVEVVELPEKKWFVGCQFHPEFKSRPDRPHPLFRAFVAASLEGGEA